MTRVFILCVWETRGASTRSQKSGSASKLDLLFIIIILSISVGRSRFIRASLHSVTFHWMLDDRWLGLQQRK
jgi:hypothetical protein